MDNFIKNILAAVCAFFGFIFGECDGMMIALIVFVVIDYISGVIAAVAEKKLSSEIGAKGIAKKIFMLLIVAAANIVDINVIGEGHALKSVTVIFYICNECISALSKTRDGSAFPFRKSCLTCWRSSRRRKTMTTNRKTGRCFYIALFFNVCTLYTYNHL